MMYSLEKPPDMVSNVELCVSQRKSCWCCR